MEEGIFEEERARRKQKVIDDAYNETHIRLDPEKMEANPGLRYLAKICLNSLWVFYIYFNMITIACYRGALLFVIGFHAAPLYGMLLD